MARKIRSCALGSAIVLFMLGSARTGSARRKVNAAAERADIAAHASLSTHTWQPGQPISFAMTLSNRGSGAARRLWLARADGLGYTIGQFCVWSGSAPSCQSLAPAPVQSPAWGASPALNVAEVLRPGQSVSLWGSLLVSGSAQPQDLLAVVGWTGADASLSETTLLLGRVSRAAPESVANATWYKVGKDLLLPVALLILTFGLPLLFQRGARRRAQLDQTWNLMLPESYKLMIGQYMPLDGALKKVVDLADEDRSAGWSDQEISRLLYSLAQFDRYRRRLARRVHGFYFKNRMGEVVASGCLHAYDALFRLSRIRGREVEKDYGELLNHVKVDESFASFEAKLGPVPPPAAPAAPTGAPLPIPIFRENWQNLKAWLGTSSPAMAFDYLRGLHAVLRLEMNRPFEFWYDSREPFEISEQTSRFLINHAGQIGEGYERISDFKEQLKWYVAASRSTSRLVSKPSFFARLRLSRTAP